MACFKNPQNDYQECVGLMSFLWCFLFGLIYLAYKGLWTHFVVVLLIAAFTGGIGAIIAWVIYPFFIIIILNNKYKRMGWKQIT